MTKFSTDTGSAAKSHSVTSGRRVAKRDKLLFHLVEFANLLTPRLTAQSKCSHLQTMNRVRRTCDRLTPEQREDLWAQERRDPNVKLIAVAETSAVNAARAARRKEAILPIWTKAIEQFGVPFTTSISIVGQFATTETIEHPNLAVAVPGVGVTSATPEELVEQIWTVRRLLCHLALANRAKKLAMEYEARGELEFAHRRKIQARRKIPLYAPINKREKRTGRPSFSVPAQPELYISCDKGKLTPMSIDLTGMLVERLKDADLSRLQICGVRYHRTKSRCCRLYVALTKKQRDCSPQCRDVRWHNFNRDLDNRARNLNEER
jgi:hypothetical protein